ncbi:MAG: hypothetical protein ACRDN9_06725 [Streptosporangiaceae bacterium]
MMTVWTVLLSEAAVAFMIALAVAVWANTRLRVSVASDRAADAGETATVTAPATEADAAEAHAADYDGGGPRQDAC